MVPCTMNALCSEGQNQGAVALAVIQPLVRSSFYRLFYMKFYILMD